MLLLRTGWMAAEALGVVSRRETGQWIVAVVSVPGAIALGEFVKFHDKIYAALLLVCYLVIVVDPLRRLIYRWRRSQGGAQGIVED
jgi:hypothetical protein